MAFQADPPYLGDIGDEREPFCRVPGHDADCDCGVDPDRGERY